MEWFPCFGVLHRAILSTTCCGQRAAPLPFDDTLAIELPQPGLLCMSELPPLELGPMPASRDMSTVDERLVHAPLPVIFALAADVERWPMILKHYKYVRFQERRSDGGGIVDMSANRPFGLLQWPTFWRSKMRVRVPGARDE